MSQQQINARMQQKHGTEAEWLTHNFVPKSGEIIVYDRDNSHTYERMKIGDGIQSVVSLPFIDQPIQELVEKLSKSLDIQRKRVDSIGTIQNGSTSGDIELQDIRLGYDGTLYESAGQAVRDQILSIVDNMAQKEYQINDWSMDEDGYLYLLNDGVVIIGPIGPFAGGSGGGGGGGGGSEKTFVISITNLLDSRIITVSEGEVVKLKFNYASIDEGGIDDGEGIGQLIVGGAVKKTFSAKQGYNELDITEYLAPGSNSVAVKIINSEQTSKSLPYTVTVAAVYLSSQFDASVPQFGGFSFTYVPTGLTEKTVYFELDGEQIGTATVTVSGRQQSFPIPAQSHGSHVLRVWFTCTVNEVDVRSNVLYYNIICVTEGNNTPIIAVTSPPLSGVEQYTNIVKKYRVYSPSSLNSAITLEVDGKVVSNLTVDRTEQTWSYQAFEVGVITQTIRCGEVYVSWTQNVTESTIHIEAETEALALYLSSYGRSNNEENPAIWENNGVSAEFENFNFASDGWLQDEDDLTVLRITGDARLKIPYKIFAQDFRTTGKTLEFEIATRDVLDYDTEVLTCYSEGRGFKITAQQLRLASEQSELGTRYKENEHIRISFVVEKKTENRLLLCYINSIMSGAVQYPEDDDFSQATPVGITIGSNDCTTDIYTIRAYDNGLTRYQVLDNWIADSQDYQERLDRYGRNDVYDTYGRVVISKLPTDLPYLVIQSTALPQFKGDKKTCSGYFTDPQHANRSYSFKDAEIDVQGTSSQYYYRKNYKLKYKKGFIMSDGSTAENYQMNENAVPTDTFTMKADVASSEGAFNVVLSMLYNDMCPYKTPAQEADSKVRQCIEGFPIVIFWDDGTETKFLGKYNFNNDKGTEEVFGFQPGDESWETLQNGTDRVGWHSADFSGDGWKTDFEARYPDKNTDITRLRALAQWLVSTDVDQATNNEIPLTTYEGVEYTHDTIEYRLAKFKNEFSDYFIEDAVLFYYLFTEMFLSIDQREKNAFPTYLKDEDRWIVLFYDADSSCGTDNKGNLTFDYYLEDIDYTAAGDPVYNGQNSVLWCNIRTTKFDKIMKMYQDLRTNNAVSYEQVNKKFEDHQSKWPEAIFNEDMYIKCLEPLILDGDGLYLPMLQGKKEQWMKWWLYNRFRYLDSKYVTGTSMTNRITIRAHQKANVFLTSYVNMYGHVYFNAAVAEHRMTRGQEYEFEWPASGAEDPVIGINDADLLTSLGDLSPLMVELIDVSGAPHISTLKLGDASNDYRNLSLNSVTLGNNKLLRHLDMRNCPNLTMTPDVSGCTNIEEIYCDGTSIGGIKLPAGGILKTLHLPGTIVNLQVINQPQLTDFVLPSYSQITTLRLENAGVVSSMAMDILNAMPENSRVRILGITVEAENDDEIKTFLTKLNSMRGLDENGNNTDLAQVSGSIHVGEINPGMKSIIEAAKVKYPSLTINYDSVGKYMTTQLVERTLSGDYVNDRLTTLYPYAFMGNTGIIGTMSFPNVTNVVAAVNGNQYSYVFANMSHVELLSLPKLEIVRKRMFTYSSIAEVDLSSVIAVEGDGFHSLQNLKKIRLPSVKSFGSNVFQYTNLIAIILPSSTVCTLGGTLGYSGHNFESGGTGYIYVPAILVDTYKAATNWSTYATQFRALEDYTIDGTLTGELDESKI